MKVLGFALLSASFLQHHGLVFAAQEKNDRLTRPSEVSIGPEQSGATSAHLDELRAAVRRTPRSAKAHHELGIALERSGDLDGALTELQTAVQLKPDDAEALYNLGVTSFEKGDLLHTRDEVGFSQYLTEAHQSLTKAWKLRRNLPHLHVYLGLIDRELGNIQASLREFEEAVKNDSKSADAYNNLGATLIGLGRSSEAALAFRRAVELNPRSGEAGLNLLNAQLQRGTIGSVLVEWRSAVEVNPTSAVARATLGHLLAFTNRRREAARNLQKAITLEPELAVAHFYLGRMSETGGELAGAVEQFETAVKLSPGTPEFLNELGLVLLKERNFTEAIAALHQAMDHNPRNAQTHYLLGRAFQQAGNRPEAEREFDEAAALSRAEDNLDKARTQTENGINALRAGRVDEAIMSLQQAVLILPEYADANYYLGLALVEKGNYTEASRAFQKAFLERPADPDIHYYFGVALWNLGNVPEATSEFRRAIELNPDDGPALCTLGWALVRQGFNQEGESHLQHARQLGRCTNSDKLH